MKERDFNLSELEIVGYANVLSSEFLPRTVAPIYSSKQLDLVLMPPYRLTDTQVCEVFNGGQEDLQRALRSGQATLLNSPIEARPGYCLWIDENLRAHYEPTSQADRNLRQFAQTKAFEAQEALINMDLDEALRLAQTAISADDTCLNAMLIKACVYQYLRAPEKVRMLARIAEKIAPGTNLTVWAELFAGLMQSQDIPTSSLEKSWPSEGGSIAVGFEQDMDLSFTNQLLASHRVLNHLNLIPDQDTAMSVVTGAN